MSFKRSFCEQRVWSMVFAVSITGEHGYFRLPATC